MYPNDLWVVSPTENYLYRIDEGTHNITKVSITGNEPRSIYVSQDKVSIYVTNKYSNSLSIFRQGILTNEVPVGKQPWAVCEDIDGNIYVANYMSDTITKIDSKNGNVLATIAVDNGPRGIVSDGNGNIYVSCFLTHTVCKVVNDKMVSSIDVGMNPEGITCDYANNIWVACYGSNIVSKIYKNKKILDVEVGSGPISVVASRDGTVYVANYLSKQVSVLTRQLAIDDDTNIQYGDIKVSNINVGENPSSLSVDSDNNVYCTNSSSNTISIINGDTVVKTLTNVCPSPTAYGDGTGGIIYNINRVSSDDDDSIVIGYDNLDAALKEILNKVITNKVETSSENVSYNNEEHIDNTNVKLALDDLYDQVKDSQIISQEILKKIHNLETENDDLVSNIEAILADINVIKQYNSTLNSRLTEQENKQIEIKNNVTELQSYFTEGKANESLNSYNLGGKEPSYYVNQDTINQIIETQVNKITYEEINNLFI